MATSGDRQYELVLLGATGFTGKLCAEHITRHLPTDLKWAIAGRNHSKLSKIAEELKAINSDRRQPAIEVAELKDSDLEDLTRKTKVLLTTVGPYALYGTPVVAACAKNGTHYLDCTGETPWVYSVAQEYDEAAKASGAIIIPQCGLESAPGDLVAYTLVSFIRANLGVGVNRITHSVQSIAGSVSGGTAASALNIFDSFSLSHLRTSLHPYALITGDAKPAARPSETFGQKLFGAFNYPGLGTLTDSLSGTQDLQIVYKTWALLGGGSFYGERFTYSSWMRTANRATGFLFHYALGFGLLLLAVPPFRWLLRRLVPQPGLGPSAEKQKGHFVKLKAVAVSESRPPRRAVCEMSYKGDMYALTGLLMAEGAMVLLRPTEENWAQKLGGGFLTPACLGGEYVERARKAGLYSAVGFEEPVGSGKILEDAGDEAVKKL